MLIQKERKVGEVVAENFHAAKVFENHGLDFCCGGKRTIEDACKTKGVDINNLLAELEKLNAGNPPSTHFDKWEADFLTDYIINNHHAYVNNAVSTIEHHLQKVVSAHGARHPEVCSIESIFTELKNELLEHMAKEERMLFPYIKKLSFAIKNSIEMPAAPFGPVDNPIKVMESEHDNAGLLLKKINALSDSYIPPADACATFRVLYGELKEFEEDLHMHIHLENNVLFPKAKAMEEKLNKIYTTL
ncbi:MAG TPA: iron-sulfur cluster repair di-iron protein [Ignavibacteria bacterium]|nr:iron-sulfur cluster repair di-iron protein [Ignavibacteria bacterium]HAX48457.1 iron-sulfur cluster repair di-iron protein [Bacteroidota bacterium]HRF64327.1 iron-sulfur cluster repair di-iron protein [Ignavibacteria bacterium]HRJ05410.1 iron-sulfur cluster repair di-iron protein [Ignavibacteria bacterium]HRJ86975.1 iron-sulfur cluster repair di-iron protein [Ignavibacteria bacterium]